MLAGYVLEFSGFVPNQAQPERARHAILALYSIFPLVCYLLGTLLFARFTLEEAAHRRIHAVLDEAAHWRIHAVPEERRCQGDAAEGASPDISRSAASMRDSLPWFSFRSVERSAARARHT